MENIQGTDKIRQYMEEILSEGIPQKYKEQSNMDEIITISRGNTRGQ